ncbi:MAG: hypothetical protein M3Z50_10220 [Actinomycetota bacterium]|nr:hypothetical protein [Actinomycetota bacterium]
MDNRTSLQRAAALLTAGAAVIHIGVAGQHFQEWWAAGAFFLVTAAAQLGWAMWLWQRPVGRWVPLGGAALNLALLAVWAVSRTTGLPFGAGHPEAVGVADVVTGVLEAGSVVLVLVAARSSQATPGVGAVRGRRAGLLTGGLAVVVALASGSAVAASMQGQSAGGYTTGGGMSMQSGASSGNGERHSMPNLPDVSKATSAQTQAARDFLARTVAATAVYRDTAKTAAAGFHIEAAWQHKLAKVARAGHTVSTSKAQLVHVPNQANRKDQRILDPQAPETLIYLRTPAGKYWLVGVMYTAQHMAPPAAYQPYLRWHFHAKCRGAGKKKTQPHDGSCPSGTKLTDSGYMTHVWFVRDPVHAYSMRATRKELLAYSTHYPAA